MVVPIEYLWVSQVVMVVLGNFGAVWLVNRAGHRMFGNRRQGVRATVPMVIFVALLSIGAMWLLSQPMEMRTA